MSGNGWKPKGPKIATGAHCGDWELFWDDQNLRASEARRDGFSKLHYRLSAPSAVPERGRLLFSDYRNTWTVFLATGQLCRLEMRWRRDLWISTPPITHRTGIGSKTYWLTQIPVCHRLSSRALRVRVTKRCSWLA